MAGKFDGTEMSPSDSPDGPYGQIILFGDSITENAFDQECGFSYAAALSHAFKRRLDVINRGFSGYNTRHGLQVLPRLMPTTSQAKVELMVICFGANDSCLPHDPTGHHVPVDVYRDNLKAMVNNPRVLAHKPRILIVTPPPVDEYQRRVADEARGFQLRRTAENTKKYSDSCKEVGLEMKIPVVDIWATFLQVVGWTGGEDLPGSRSIPKNEAFQGLFTDGLHLTAAGYKLVFDQVMRAIIEHYPSLDPEKMEYVYPPRDALPL